MGILSRIFGGGQPAPTPVELTSDAECLSWPEPVDIVAGESHYESALRRIAGPPRDEGWHVEVDLALQREPDNESDSDAIAVLIDGTKVGYISADVCGKLAPAMEMHGPVPRIGGIPGLVRGGWTDMPGLGVLMWLHHEEVSEALAGADLRSIAEDYPARGWPPGDLTSG